MRRLAEFLQDGAGQYSSTRLLFLAWGFGVGAIWGVLSIRAGQLLVVPLEIVGIIASLGAVKVSQLYGETPDAPKKEK